MTGQEPNGGGAVGTIADPLAALKADVEASTTAAAAARVAQKQAILAAAVDQLALAAMKLKHSLAAGEGGSNLSNLIATVDKHLMAVKEANK